MSIRYPSRQEVIAHQRGENERLRRVSIIVEYAASTLPPIPFREIVGELVHPPERPSPAPALGDDQCQFLRDIRDNPADGLKARYDRLSWGVSRGNAVLATLKAARLLEVTQKPSSSPFGGRGRRVPTLTPRGHEVLQAYERTQKP